MHIPRISLHRGKYGGQTLLIFFECVHLKISVILAVFVSAGGYGNGQVHRSPFHGQTQILQTEQDLCRVSLEATRAAIKSLEYPALSVISSSEGLELVIQAWCCK